MVNTKSIQLSQMNELMVVFLSTYYILYLLYIIFLSFTIMSAKTYMEFIMNANSLTLGVGTVIIILLFS